MRFQYIIKNLMCVFLLASFFCSYNTMYAELLSFKAGDKASYTISQKLNSECEISDEKINSQSEATMDLDIKILSANQQTSSYPFDVEVTLKRILISGVEQDSQGTTVIKYDSDSSKPVENSVLAEHLNKLINHPLTFSVNKDFKVKETTGYLTQINKNFDSPSDMGLFGTTPWTFELLLTQLFHLSGKNLLAAKSYPASCYQFLNWEDDKLDEQEISLHQSSNYVINNMDSKQIKASWKGKAKVADTEDDMEGHVSLVGNVTWDIANPMIQKRDLKVKIEETRTGFIPSHVKMSVKQTWQPASL
jgi:hypothetical protein